VRAVAEAHARGGRVVAVGTTVVRALEGAALKAGGLRAGPGETDLLITPAIRPRVVDGVLSGAHAAHESHFSLLAAFAGPALLAGAAVRAERAGFLTHELGDSMLVLPGALAAASARRPAPGIAA
jgi:S-adenosylmethionine:tRNA ribosyltransferase-isomerase